MTNKLLKDFEVFLTDLGLKETSIERHKCSLSILGDNLESFEKVNSFLKKLKSKGYTPSYLTSLVCSVRRWSQFLEKQGFEVDERLKKYPMFGKKTRNVRATLTDKEIEAFLSLPAPTTTHKSRWSNKIITRPVNPKVYYKWATFFSIMAYTGMRPGEVAKLTKEDVDFKRKLFILRDTKTNNPRLVPMPEFLKKKLKDYCQKVKTKLLFARQNKRNVPENNGNWHYNFQARIKRLGIKRANLTPYSLRHSFITNNISKNVNLFNLQAIVGHRDIRTTREYVHLDVESLRNIINRKSQTNQLEKRVEENRELLLKIANKLDIKL